MVFIFVLQILLIQLFISLYIFRFSAKEKLDFKSHLENQIIRKIDFYFYFFVWPLISWQIFLQFNRLLDSVLRTQFETQFEL